MLDCGVASLRILELHWLGRSKEVVHVNSLHEHGSRIVWGRFERASDCMAETGQSLEHGTQANEENEWYCT